MVSWDQIEKLEKLLGKYVHLCSWIEYQISIYHALVETKDIPSGIYQDKNFNICVNRNTHEHYLKTWSRWKW